MLTEEIWKPIEGYEGFYEISNSGRLKSNTRKIWNGRCWYKKQGKIMKQSKTTTGYWKAELVGRDKIRKSFKVHRMVAESFISKVEGKDLINHKDGNPLNNKVGNLEWCTQSENMQHAHDTGLIKNELKKFEKEIATEYETNKEITMNGLAKKYGCSITAIQRYLRKNKVVIRGISHTQNIYSIDREKMVAYFREGLRDKQIAEKLGGNRKLIGTYRSMYKKGKLKIKGVGVNV
jgi:LysM repeat protein